MNAKEIMIIAPGEAHELFAVELVQAIRDGLTSQETGYEEGSQPLHASLEPRFYGVGGSRLAAAGVELVAEPEHGSESRKTGDKLYHVASEREPNAIIHIGGADFETRLSDQIRSNLRRQEGTFYNWRPLLFQIGFPAAPSTATAEGTPAADLAKFNVDAGKHVKTRDPSVIEIPVQPNDTARSVAEIVVRHLLQSEAHFPLKASLY